VGTSGVAPVRRAPGSASSSWAAFYRPSPCKLVAVTDPAHGADAVADQAPAPPGAVEPPVRAEASTDRLETLKALGDNTRYAIYLELVRSPKPLATAEIADALGLHHNTVRPHLERMREVGLVDRKVHHQGVGRPQHRYSLAADAPSLGLEPPTFPLLASMLARTAAAAGASSADAAEIGREEGRADALRLASEPCLDAVVAQLTRLGFDPAVVTDPEMTTIAFTHCPFADLAAEHPEIICHLHRGLIEGLIEFYDGTEVADFRTYVDRSPCQVDLVPG
jgi:predicted ArsR family transcriptional regulator